jgi:putative membrane protein
VVILRVFQAISDVYAVFHDNLICLMFSDKNSSEMMCVAAEDSLNQSMDKVVKRYSSLFRLPSYSKVLLLLALSCLSAGILSTITVFPPFEALVNGLFLGFSLFLVNLIFDYVVSMLILGRDPIYDLRRTTALSVFCWALWLLFIFVGVAIEIPVRLCLLGFSAVLILRLVAFNSTSFTDSKRLLAASLLQPFPCIIPFLMFWAEINYFLISLFFIFSTVIIILSSFLFISLLNRAGEQTLGIPSLSLFKAFLLNWIVGLNAPFEEFLEKLGEEQDIKVSLIKFDAPKPKAVIVVPSVHPGPFKNVGSSLLPSMLKTALEKELKCVACVPHGLLGHELDLASQIQNQKIINSVVESANFKASEAKATPFFKVSNGLATACCQVFGKFALLSFTLAPKTTEDLPQELGLFVQEKAEKHGLTHCAVVNAHNSINGIINIQEALNALKVAATNCLEQAASLKRLPFKVGAATVVPKEFGLKDGMGPGGITTVMVEVDKQKTAYVVIDGNNMVSGLREKILSTLQFMGIGGGEVFTTDTHAVNAVILSDRGYHPIGEAIDHKKLIGYIKKAALAAVSDLERAKATARSITVPNVKVIGEKKLETLCLLTDRTLQKAKKIIIPIFAASGILLMLLLTFV